MHEARPHLPQIAATFLVSLLATPLALLTPLPLKIAVDSVLGDEPLPRFLEAALPPPLVASAGTLLALAVGLLLAVAVLVQCQDLAASLLRTYTSERLLLNFRAKLFDHLQRLALAYHDRVGPSDSVYRIQYDAASLPYVVVDSAISFVTALATVAAMIAITAGIDWQLAIVALTVSPAIALVSQGFRGRLRQRARDVKERESGAMSVAQEVLAGLRLVRAFGQEEREQERFVDRFSDGMRARIQLTLAQGAYGVLIGFVIALGSAAVLFIGVSRVQAGAVTLGELLLVMGYLTQLYSPLKTMAKRAGTLQSHLSSAQRSLDLLDQAPDIVSRAGARPVEQVKGAVEFHKVSFGYDPERRILDDVSFEVPPGTRAGLAGVTGAGKSTLLSLLVRFYDPSSGRILLDGVDLRDYRLGDLRSQFAIVLQEPILFSTTIAENIAYARPGATPRDIEHAATAANIHGFITQLPRGYDTQVGERGVRLSGGERQRISLARAFLKDAPILVLDEPTSSVDLATEALIVEAMQRLMAGRTSFIVAHRPATLEICDLRLHVAAGRVRVDDAERNGVGA